MAKLDQLKGLDEPVREHCTDRASIVRQRTQQREVTDFLYELSLMRENRRYAFCGDFLESVYASIDKSGYVTPGQRKAVNNIRRGCREHEI